jgi:hypothetical protein
MEPYIDEFGNLQFKQPANYTGINGINMNQLNIEPYNSMAEMRGQPESRSVLDQGLPFALPNLNYRNYDLSNLFNRNTQPDFINASQDDYASLYSLPELDTSRFKGMDLESGYLDRAGSSDQDIYAEQEKQKGGGIGGLLKFLVGLAVPGAGFLMNLPGRGLEGIRSLNQRIQGSDFGQATSIADYLDMRKYGGAQGRRDASARTMAQARGLQKEMAQRPSAMGGGGGGGGRDMGASVSRSAAATRSKDLGSMRGGVGR